MQETFNEKTIPKYQTTQCRFDFQSLLFQFPLKEGINSKVLTYNQIGFLSNAENLIILYPQNGPKIIQNQTWFNLGCGKFKASSRGSPPPTPTAAPCHLCKIVPPHLWWHWPPWHFCCSSGKAEGYPGGGAGQQIYIYIYISR